MSPTAPYEKILELLASEAEESSLIKLLKDDEVHKS